MTTSTTAAPIQLVVPLNEWYHLMKGSGAARTRDTYLAVLRPWFGFLAKHGAARDTPLLLTEWALLAEEVEVRREDLAAVEGYEQGVAPCPRRCPGE